MCPPVSAARSAIRGVITPPNALRAAPGSSNTRGSGLDDDHPAKSGRHTLWVVTDVRVREAAPADCPAIYELIVALAVYEKEPDAVEGSVEDLRAHLFGPTPQVFCHVAEVRDEAGTWSVAGIAIWYVTFSTWKVRHGIWLEDLFVRPQARGLGLGRLLLAELATIALQRGYPRFEWWVLDWNTPAQGFYESLGAIPQDEWTVWRTSGAALTALGSDPARDPG